MGPFQIFFSIIDWKASLNLVLGWLEGLWTIIVHKRIFGQMPNENTWKFNARCLTFEPSRDYVWPYSVGFLPYATFFIRFIFDDYYNQHIFEKYCFSDIWWPPVRYIIHLDFFQTPKRKLCYVNGRSSLCETSASDVSQFSLGNIMKSTRVVSTESVW